MNWSPASYRPLPGSFMFSLAEDLKCGRPGLKRGSNQGPNPARWVSTIHLCVGSQCRKLQVHHLHFNLRSRRIFACAQLIFHGVLTETNGQRGAGQNRRVVKTKKIHQNGDIFKFGRHFGRRKNGWKTAKAPFRCVSSFYLTCF